MPTMEEIICAPPAEGELFSAQAAFGDAALFELEIGCGKGGFLLRRAQQRPDLHLLGIEWANKFFKYTAYRMARRDIANVRIMRTDAGPFVRHHLPPACLAALHVYHPDPWPKKRHHKRRLIQADFVAAAARALAPGGRWALQTDHAEYFAWMQEVFAASAEPAGLAPIPYDDPAFGIVEDFAQTNFEIKYRREGRPIYRMALQKQGPR